MTYIEYLSKRENFASSSATKEQIHEAIKRLDESYLLSQTAVLKAKQQIEESKPDISDMNGDG